MSRGVLEATKMCVGGAVAMRGEGLFACRLCGTGGVGRWGGLGWGCIVGEVPGGL